MKRMVLDRDLNALVEENIKKAWAERKGIEGKEPDQKSENNRGRGETDSEQLAEDKRNRK